jgi:glyoxylase-like metal-dependent hydrolase (beta-lactamase superfamily II)
MKISDKVEMIDGTMANVYVIKRKDRIIQIDTGMKNNFQKIVQYYEYNRSKPDIIFITHYHMDHIGSLREMIEKYNPVIISSNIEKDYLSGKLKPEKPRSIIGKLVYKMMPPLDFKNVMTPDYLNDQDIDVILTNGHTPGSSSLLLKDEKMIFIGDAAREKDGKLEIDRTFTLNQRTALDSLNKIKSLKPVLVLPGHGNPVKLE